MPNPENIPVTPEVTEESLTEVQLTPAEMFLNDLTANDDQTPETPEQAVETPEVLAAEESMGESEVAPEQEAEQPVSTEQDYKNTIATLLDIVKASQAQQAAQSQPAPVAEEPAPAPEPVEEEEPFDEEAFNEQFYANPAATIRTLAEQIANKNVKERLSGLEAELAPLLEESKAVKHRELVKGAIDQFLDTAPDANDYLESIAQYVRENNLPTDDVRSYADAYKEAKLNSQANLIEQLKQANADGGRSLADYLADEESLKQIIADSNVKSQVIAQYLNELKDGGRPATIMSGGSAQIPGTAPTAAGSIDDAAHLFLRDLKR